MKYQPWMIGTLLLVSLCGSARADSVDPDLATWRQKRDASLRQTDGWLTLAGLFWLHDGTNTVGSAEGCDVRFPASAPAHVGTFEVSGHDATFTTAAGADVTTNGHPLQSVTIKADDEEGSTILQRGSLSWYVIRRDGRLGVRLKDSASPVLAAFKGVTSYPASAQWKIDGTLHRFDHPRKVAAPTAMGHDTEIDIIGTLDFTCQGQALSLEVMQDDGETDLSLIFADRTNGHGSYPGGRYLTVAAPDADGHVVIDFNRAYNPPCAFTPYATCVYPSKNSRLPVAVEAGEMFSGHH